jgi:hypothetical protein
LRIGFNGKRRKYPRASKITAIRLLIEATTGVARCPEPVDA